MEKENLTEEEVDLVENENTSSDVQENPEELKTEKTKKKSKTAQQMQKLQEENDALQNYAMRMKADLENIKKRNENIARDMYNDGRCDTILAFLPVVDNLERAMELEMPDGIKEGLSKVKKQIDTIFERLNVTEIPSLGEEFNPNFHNALMQIDDEENSGKCVQVYEKGYKINDKILRHASVVVAK